MMTSVTTSEDYYEYYEDFGKRKHNFRRLRDHLNPLCRFNDANFKSRFRMDKSTFMELRQAVPSRNAITNPLTDLLVVLDYYATGAYQMCIGDHFGLHKTTVCRIIKTVSKEIASLRHQYIYMPDSGEKLNISKQFQDLSKMSNIIGAIDCTHIRIQSPGGLHENAFINRKGYYSINVQIVGDTSYRIRNIVARWAGSTHDSRIFNESVLKSNLEDGNVSGILLGDGGYAARLYMLTPVCNPSTAAERRYNYHHCVGRNVIERLFGIWKRCFSILGPDSRIRLKLDTTMAVIVACAVLHNFIRQHKAFTSMTSECISISDEQSDNASFNTGSAYNSTEGAAFRKSIINSHFRD